MFLISFYFQIPLRCHRQPKLPRSNNQGACPKSDARTKPPLPTILDVESNKSSLHQHQNAHDCNTGIGIQAILIPIQFLSIKILPHKSICCHHLKRILFILLFLLFFIFSTTYNYHCNRKNQNSVSKIKLNKRKKWFHLVWFICLHFLDNMLWYFYPLPFLFLDWLVLDALIIFFLFNLFGLFTW